MVTFNKDGVRRYTDGNIDIGISKEGDSYRVYNYKNDSLTKEMSKSDVNAILRSYNGEKLAVLEAQEVQLREYERLQAEAKEIDTYARGNIKEYKTLNAPNQSMIRKVIREGRANGIADSDVLMYAKISAHSGLDIVFDKNENFVRTKADGSEYYADGFYEASKNRIVVNPESKRTGEALLIHELDHAITNVYGKKGRKAVVKMYKTALEGVDEQVKNNILAEYGGDIATLVDETNSVYAEKVLTNRYTLEKLLEAEPTLKEKILSFFKGASQDYADVPKLSGAAKKYYRTYKKLFDEFSARNAQNNAMETLSSSSTAIANPQSSTTLASGNPGGPPSPILGKAVTSENANKKPLTSINQGNMSVSGRQYAIKFLSENDLPQYLRAGNRSNKYKQEAINSGKKIILTTPEETRTYIEKSISGEKDMPVVAYGVVDEKLSQDVSNYSKNKINIENYYLELVSNDIHHAYQEHIKAKEKGDIDLSFEDFAQIPYYVATYDDFVYAIKYKNGSTKICVSKKISDGRVLVIETVSKSHGSIEFKNLIGVSEQKYIEEYENKHKKRNSTNTGGNVSSNNSPHDESVSDISIPQKTEIDNTFDKKVWKILLISSLLCRLRTARRKFPVRR